jgi:hypothetical protein
MSETANRVSGGVRLAPHSMSGSDGTRPVLVHGRKPVLVHGRKLALNVTIHGLTSHSTKRGLNALFKQPAGRAAGLPVELTRYRSSQPPVIDRTAVQSSSMLNFVPKHAASLRLIPGFDCRRWTEETPQAAGDPAPRRLANRLVV